MICIAPQSVTVTIHLHLRQCSPYFIWLFLGWGSCKATLYHVVLLTPLQASNRCPWWSQILWDHRCQLCQWKTAWRGIHLSGCCIQCLFPPLAPYPNSSTEAMMFVRDVSTQVVSQTISWPFLQGKMVIHPDACSDLGQFYGFKDGWVPS